MGDSATIPPSRGGDPPDRWRERIHADSTARAIQGRYVLLRSAMVSLMPGSEKPTFNGHAGSFSLLALVEGVSTVCPGVGTPPSNSCSRLLIWAPSSWHCCA